MIKKPVSKHAALRRGIKFRFPAVPLKLPELFKIQTTLDSIKSYALTRQSRETLLACCFGISDSEVMGLTVNLYRDLTVPDSLEKYRCIRLRHSLFCVIFITIK